MEYNLIKIVSLPHRQDIILNNPPVNILTGALMTELLAALQVASADRALRVVVLRSEGKAWSAGADVGEHLPDKFEAMLDVFGKLCETVRTFPVPTIAAVDGLCLGGGCELACMCDFLIASEKAKFGQPEIKVGVLPPVAASHFGLKYGFSRALEIVLTGDIYSAQDAGRLGLVNQLVPAEGLAEAVDNYAAKFTALSAVVLRTAKAAALTGLDYSGKYVLQVVDDIYRRQLMAASDAVEGLNAFLEKRPPNWKDR
ncbi:MAG: enoyl-CoA hydratase/isomerase family protein [Calditrichaeota bacterium]|nr:enoyl-CoA hydratase/isomerase family protein [Calditrichota bacterium]